MIDLLKQINNRIIDFFFESRKALSFFQLVKTFLLPSSYVFTLLTRFSPWSQNLEYNQRRKFDEKSIMFTCATIVPLTSPQSSCLSPTNGKTMTAQFYAFAIHVCQKKVGHTRIMSKLFNRWFASFDGKSLIRHCSLTNYN